MKEEELNNSSESGENLELYEQVTSVIIIDDEVYEEHKNE